MSPTRPPHGDTPRPAGTVRVDCHVHTMWSGDATTTPEELEEAVATAGIDVLCITDHHTVNGALAVAGRLPCRVVVGEEVRTRSGELIGLFLRERLPPGLPAEEAAAAIRAQGGLVYVPHPFDPARHAVGPDDLDALAKAGLVDVVEVLNAKVAPFERNAEVAAYAGERGLPGGAGSDAHVPQAVGAAYVEMADFDGPRSFLDALGAARLVGRHCDPPRAWRPRVVPSTSAL